MNLFWQNIVVTRNEKKKGQIKKTLQLFAVLPVAKPFMRTFLYAATFNIHFLCFLTACSGEIKGGKVLFHQPSDGQSFQFKPVKATNVVQIANGSNGEAQVPTKYGKLTKLKMKACWWQPGPQGAAVIEAFQSYLKVPKPLIQLAFAARIQAVFEV